MKKKLSIYIFEKYTEELNGRIANLLNENHKLTVSNEALLKENEALMNKITTIEKKFLEKTGEFSSGEPFSPLISNEKGDVYL